MRFKVLEIMRLLVGPYTVPLAVYFGGSNFRHSERCPRRRVGALGLLDRRAFRLNNDALFKRRRGRSFVRFRIRRWLAGRAVKLSTRDWKLGSEEADQLAWRHPSRLAHLHSAEEA